LFNILLPRTVLINTPGNWLAICFFCDWETVTPLRSVLEYNIGAKIKELRKASHLTLQKVAKETGFSPALISQIENNNIAPPIATLSKLAHFFDVKIGYFFDEEYDRRYEVVRVENCLDVGRAPSGTDKQPGYRYKSLAGHKFNKRMGAYLVTVTESNNGDVLPWHAGEEFLIILRGAAEVLLNNERIKLNTGDAVYIDSSLRYRLLACDGEAVQALAVVTR